jgi:hypothetical protein
MASQPTEFWSYLELSRRLRAPGDLRGSSSAAAAAERLPVGERDIAIVNLDRHCVGADR